MAGRFDESAKRKRRISRSPRLTEEPVAMAMSDDETSPNTPEGTDTTNHESATVVTDLAAEPSQASEPEATDTVKAASDAAAATTDMMLTAGTDTASVSADTTAQAFEEVRSRLQNMAGSGDQASAILEPFRASADMFRQGSGFGVAGTSEALAELNALTMAAWLKNAEAAADHWRRLATVRSFADLIALNAEFTRKQLEHLGTQTREFMATAARVARTSTPPSAG